ncbi:NusA-like transcription termination signal-binding factor [Candidatus Woesearchaeota archaeon]|nr:NusA-like transcription termination signal-binding factor [Candidatus Woesearchaeota archaeon]
MKIKFTPELMGFMSVFHRITNANLKDCFVDDNSTLTFVVSTGELGKAIGKKAINIKSLEKSFKKKVRIIEFHAELEKFIKSLVYPSKIDSIELQENIVTIQSTDSQSRGYLIGRAASNLRNYEKIVKRYFDIIEIKVT